MATVATYQRLIRDILTDRADLYRAHVPASIDQVLVFDDARGHYLWLESGWENHRRVERIIVHARLSDDQIAIEEDWTEDGVATLLIAAGVPAERIALAFHDPALRASPQALFTTTAKAPT